jgi:hypothetical protein
MNNPGFFRKQLALLLGLLLFLPQLYFFNPADKLAFDSQKRFKEVAHVIDAIGNCDFKQKRLHFFRLLIL